LPNDQSDRDRRAAKIARLPPGRTSRPFQSRIRSVIAAIMNRPVAASFLLSIRFRKSDRPLPDGLTFPTLNPDRGGLA
jgi:hypothetical protein